MRETASRCAALGVESLEQACMTRLQASHRYRRRYRIRLFLMCIGSRNKGPNPIPRKRTRGREFVAFRNHMVARS